MAGGQLFFFFLWNGDVGIFALGFRLVRRSVQSSGVPRSLSVGFGGLVSGRLPDVKVRSIVLLGFARTHRRWSACACFRSDFDSTPTCRPNGDHASFCDRYRSVLFCSMIRLIVSAARGSGASPRLSLRVPT